MNPEIEKKLLFSMLRIRMVQERIESKYLEDEMKTPVHLCFGQEAVPVGISGPLSPEDYISSNHRGHGHYLAKGGDLNRLIAELHCKANGCSKGFGGSMHLVDCSVGHMGSSSIVGGGIPIGTGLALAIQMKAQDRVSVIFFGDGAADEGVLYESVNYAILKKLPVIYVLENNQWSVCSSVCCRQAHENVFHHLPGSDLLTAKIDGNDVLSIYETAEQCVERARRGEGPSFVECKTYRVLGHAGCLAQDPAGYRDELEIEEWKEKCPVKRLQEDLMGRNLLRQSDIDHMRSTIDGEIDDAFSFAEKGNLPPKNQLDLYLYSD